VTKVSRRNPIDEYRNAVMSSKHASWVFLSHPVISMSNAPAGALLRHRACFAQLRISLHVFATDTDRSLLAMVWQSPGW